MDTRQLRSFGPKAGTRRERRSLLTAQAMEDDRQRCLDAGMDDYIAKPIAIQALRGVLEQWVPPLHETAFAAARPEEPMLL
jgi:two-component system sensor histidine kinase EvgS